MEQRKRDVIRDSLLLLLTTQYIESRLKENEGRIWQVRLGSGMGLCHSGQVADLAMMMLGEASMVTRPEQLRRSHRDAGGFVTTDW